MIRRDLPEVLQIEAEGFEFPWDEAGFIRCLRQKDCIGMVAELNPPTPHSPLPTAPIAGFMIYELSRTKIHLHNFAVAAAFRRHGVGRQMAAKLIGKLSPQRRTRITLEIRERNLPGQLFFRECGFRAVSILRRFYEETDEDALLMVRKYGGRD